MEQDAPGGCGRAGTQQSSGDGALGCGSHAAGGCQRGERPEESGKHDRAEPQKQKALRTQGTSGSLFRLQCVRR